MKKTLISLAFLFVFGCAVGPYVSGKRQVNHRKNHHETRFKGVEGLSLFSQSWLPENQKTKAVVIMVHGLKDHSDRYQWAAEQLNKNGYAVYSYDHRGHGDSEGQRVWVNNFDEYISDLETYYDLVKMQEPGKPIYIFGHSMGGAIVTLFSLKNSRPIKGMILSGPALKVGDDISGFLIGTTNMLGSILPSLAVMGLKDEAFSKDEKVVQQIKNDPLIYRGKGPARTAKELLKAIADIQNRMAEVNTPFLVLHGDKDVLTNPEGSRELYTKAKQKDKTLKIYPGVLHDLLHEPEKPIIMADMISWLNTRNR